MVKLLLLLLLLLLFLKSTVVVTRMGKKMDGATAGIEWCNVVVVAVFADAVVVAIAGVIFMVNGGGS